MTHDFNELLKFLKDSVCMGTCAQLTPAQMQLACEQQVEGFFLDSLDEQNRLLMIRKYSLQFIRYRRIYETLKNLNDNGIETFVIKGISLARYYPDYIRRRCSDTDVLVKHSDFAKIIKILKKRNFTIYKMREEEHHLKVSHCQTGTIEFHYRLCDEIFDKLWFGGSYVPEESPVSFEIDSMTFYTLGATDTFIFLFLHFIKHYVNEFVTLKWILDILFFLKYNYRSVDWEKATAIVEKMGYTTLLNTIYGVGIEYLGFDSEIFAFPEYSRDKVDIFLSDVEFCAKKENQQNLSQFFHYLNCKTNKVDNYEKFIIKYNKLSFLDGIFPNRSHLENKYKILSKHPYLLPFIWIYRIILAVVNLFRGKRTISDFRFSVPDSNEIMDNRMSVMRELDII